MANVLDQRFTQAIAAFQDKRPEAAAQLCREMLQDTPTHAGSLHLLGVIEAALGHIDEAENLVRRSIALRPGFAEMHFSFAQILASAGKQDEAIEHYQKVLAIKPHHAGTLVALAALHNLRGGAACEQGRYAEAREFFEEALVLRPDFPEALNNLGVVSFEQGRYPEAAQFHERALILKPDYVAALNNLGNALKAQGQWPEAIACYRRALEVQPDLPQAQNNLGLALLHGEFDCAEAAACFQKVIDVYPAYVPALTHLGITYCLRGAFHEGVAIYQKALAIEPSYRDALNNLGNALRALGQIDEAIATYQRVVALKPGDPDGRHNLAMALLTAGRFEEGWREYEWRWRTPQLAPAVRNFAQPQWQGEAGDGRILFLHAEQGFGDTIQFCRYAPLAAERGWRIILEVQPELKRLLGSLSGVERVIARGDALPDFDRHCPLLSLPHAFSTSIDTIPAARFYLKADPKETAAWREKLSKTKRNIGLVWTGNPRLFSLDLAAANHRRSIPLAALTPLATLPDVQFYNLQKDATEFPQGLSLIDFMADCRDFADTAALIAALDMVVTVDTSVAHLAGALGKPVCLLNRFDTCWRWLQGREDSPWYPSMRVFRQAKPGDWEGGVQTLVRQLSLETA